MKSSIHPQWNHAVTVTCSCGNTFTTGSTLQNIVVDICSACHPHYTGEMKFVDRQKRVDKFLKKVQVAQAKQELQSQRSPKNGGADAEDPKSYQDILREQQSALKQQQRAAKAA